MSSPCYKCGGENWDSDYTHFCFSCRIAMTKPPEAPKTFLTRLTVDDLQFLRDMKIEVESDMRKSALK